MMHSLNERSIGSLRVFLLILLIGFLMVGLVSAVRVVYASIPDTGGVIHACYDSGNRMLRVIDTESGEACRTQEMALSWNKMGPQGPQGPQGSEGPRGPSDGYVTSLIPANAKNVDNRTVNVLSLSLPAGDYLLSASVRVERNQSGTSTVFCDLRVGGGPFPTGYLERLDGADAVATMAATNGISLTSNEMVHLTCSAFGDDGTSVTLADLTAIKVGKVTRQ